MLSKKTCEAGRYRFCPLCTTSLRWKSVGGRSYQACPRCEFIFWNNPKPVVSVLLHTGRKVLLLQRAQKPLRGYWCLPGGFIENDETPEHAAMREVREEVGGKAAIASLIGIYRINNDPRGVHLDIIYAGTLKDRIMLSDEHDAYDFFAPDRLPSKIAYKHREAIHDWRVANKEVT